MANDYNIVGRIERLPSSSYLYLLVILISLGTFWDSYMLFTIGGIAAHFITQAHATSFSYYVPALLFLGTFIGAVSMGTLSDTIGRKNAFTLDVGILAIGALIAFLSSNIFEFGAGLLIAGIGTGAEIPLSGTYSQELAPTRMRASVNTLVLTIGFLGGTIGGFANLFLIPISPTSYKLVLLIAAIGGFLTLLIRLYVPESPRWYVSKGREEDADKVLKLIETKTINAKGLKSLPEPKLMEEPIKSKLKISDLFKGAYRRRTISAWAIEFFQGFGFYGFSTFVPVFLYGLGYSIVKALAYTAIIQISYTIGPLLTLLYVEKIPRKTGMAILYFINMLFGIGFAVSGIERLSSLFVVGLGFMTELLVFMDGPLLHIYEVEIYPAYARGSGSSYSFALSRLGGFLAPLIGASILIAAPSIGYKLIIIWAAIAWAICSIIAALVAVNTKGLSLENLEKSVE